jgi:CheY-like chemotaxis protein/HPt (histidine-containing phosphotransfer) domain-containing protein
VTPAELSRQFSGRRVLLVEDNEVNRELAHEMLSNIGLTVDTAENGLQAVEAVQRAPYDLVLMDCQMPVMDGYAATAKIRDELQMRKLPIVAMTANALASDRDRCLTVGMNDHIPKPIDVAILHATLAHWLTIREGENPLPAAAIPESAKEPSEIDTASALARMGGNRSMYDRLLVRFRENQGDAVDQLRAEQALGDSAAMLLRAHTLRGLAGNIGAVGLSRLAAELEERLRQGTPTGDEEVGMLLAKLGEALPNALSIPATLPETSRPSTPDANREVHSNALSSLRQLLDNDDAAAVRYFEEISGWLGQHYDPLLVEQLTRQIGQYEFEDASATLQQLARNRGKL